MVLFDLGCGAGSPADRGNAHCDIPPSMHSVRRLIGFWGVWFFSFWHGELSGYGWVSQCASESIKIPFLLIVRNQTEYVIIGLTLRNKSAES